MPKVSMIYFLPSGRTQACLVPSLAADQKIISRMKLNHGDVVSFDLRAERNGKHHRLVFQMLNFVFENQSRFDSIDALRWFLTMQTSFVHEYLDQSTGEVIRIPRSWTYAEMDEIEFSTLHSEIVDVIIKNFYPTENENWLKSSMNESAFLDGLMSFF